MDETVRVVRDWQEAANSQDVAGVLVCSAPDIAIVGPRGEARGHEVLRAWLARAGLSLTTRQLYVRGDSAVADQRGVWRSPETGEVIDEADVATWFRVADGQVQFLARYNCLADALAAAGLRDNDRLDDAASPLAEGGTKPPSEH